MRKFNIKLKLLAYDAVIFFLVDLLLLILLKSKEGLSWEGIIFQTLLSFVCVFFVRIVGGIYNQIWRYGGVQCYIRLLLTDGFAFCINLPLQLLLPESVGIACLLSIASLDLLGVLCIRMVYRYAYNYDYSRRNDLLQKTLRILFKIFVDPRTKTKVDEGPCKIKIAIIGAGRVGVSLAEELLNNKLSAYAPSCFIDVSRDKIDRIINGIPVLLENEATLEYLKLHGIQEVVFAIPNLDEENKKRLYHYYSSAGYKIKVYDFPVMQSAGAKRHLREFDVEELLFRKPIVIENDRNREYYQNKVVLITGGGGSIGSELCRQLAKMSPRQIIILDIYENGAYEIQQELKYIYKDRLDIRIEIASIANKRAMARVFESYHPQIVINAAAHKHVPLMEHNCIEAVENNVFGTATLVELCEEYGTDRFMMVSTDKAVNPTNVMGATKRMCEMIVQGASTCGRVKYSATRFGNVLGSAGSVIPLFKKQIMNGGPITLTDKRIIRYFMTIPEAAQLVLESGTMAKNGELFVLDMGQPVKILDLAENMIRLLGVSGIDIVETGLRPGEKLYEELLVNTKDLDKTDNSLIFIEKEQPISRKEVEYKLNLLRKACESDNDDLVREALREAVPTYKTPEEVNSNAEDSEEMKNQHIEVKV